VQKDFCNKIDPLRTSGVQCNPQSVVERLPRPLAYYYWPPRNRYPAILPRLAGTDAVRSVAANSSSSPRTMPRCAA